MVTSNFNIFYGDRSGLDRRLLMINFANPVDMSKRDHDLSDKLISELDRLTPIALSLSENLVKNYILAREEGQILEHDALKWEVQTQSDSISSWIDERIIFDASCSEPVGTAKSTTQHLYANYLDFCEEGRFTPKSLQNFSRDVLAVCFTQGYKVEKRHIEGGKKIFGLRLRNALDKESFSGRQVVSQTLEHIASNNLESSSQVVSQNNNPSGGQNTTTHTNLTTPDDLDKKPDDFKSIYTKPSDDSDYPDDLKEKIFYPLRMTS